MGAAVEGALPRPRPRVVWQTGYYRRWANHFAAQTVHGRTLPTSHRLTYQQLFDPHFPEVWHGFLEHLSRYPADGPARPLAARAAEAGGTVAGIPAYVLFRPVPDLCDSRVVARLLAHETAADRASLVRYLACQDVARAAVPGYSTEAVDAAVTRRTLLQLWTTGPEELETVARSRGFRSIGHAVESLKPFLPGLLDDQQRAKEGVLTDAR
jgi:hypothetical protein